MSVFSDIARWGRANWAHAAGAVVDAEDETQYVFPAKPRSAKDSETWDADESVYNNEWDRSDEYYYYDDEDDVYYDERVDNPVNPPIERQTFVTSALNPLVSSFLMRLIRGVNSCNLNLNLNLNK